MIPSVSVGLPASFSAAPLAAAPSGGASFGEVLGNVMQQAAGTLQQAEQASVAAMEGRMDIRQAVDQVLAAERTLQAAIAIRDKAVGAYLEINRMQI